MHFLKLKKETYKELYAFRKEKKERKGLSRETFVFKTVCWCNSAGTLNICLALTSMIVLARIRHRKSIRRPPLFTTPQSSFVVYCQLCMHCLLQRKPSDKLVQLPVTELLRIIKFSVAHYFYND